MPDYDPKNDPYAELPVKDFSYTNNPSNPNLNKQPEAKSNKKWIYLAAIGLVVILIAVAAVLFLHHKKTPTPKKSSTKSSLITTPSTTKNSSFGLSFNPSTMYNSNNFNLEVNYPSSWKVNDIPSALTILSPVTALKNASGQIVNGKIEVSVFNQGSIPTAFGTNNSVAVLNSIHINYGNPTQTQAAQTYISFIQYPATTTKGGLDAIYITGNYGYTYAQTIPNSDITNISPLVVVSFLGCSNTTCTSPTNLTIASTEWSNSGFSTLIQDILKSFILN